jgi:hypothetical protein
VVSSSIKVPQDNSQEKNKWDNTSRSNKFLQNELFSAFSIIFVSCSTGVSRALYSMSACVTIIKTKQTKPNHLEMVWEQSPMFIVEHWVTCTIIHNLNR